MWAGESTPSGSSTKFGQLAGGICITVLLVGSRQLLLDVLQIVRSVNGLFSDDGTPVHRSFDAAPRWSSGKLSQNSFRMPDNRRAHELFHRYRSVQADMSWLP